VPTAAVLVGTADLAPRTNRYVGAAFAHPTDSGSCRRQQLVARVPPYVGVHSWRFPGSGRLLIGADWRIFNNRRILIVDPSLMSLDYSRMISCSRSNPVRKCEQDKF
jgi:hypothetical protein